MTNEKEIIINTENTDGLKAEVEALIARRAELKNIWTPAYAEYKKLGEELEPLQAKLKGIALLTHEKTQKKNDKVFSMRAKYTGKKDQQYIVRCDVMYKVAKKVLSVEEWKGYVGRQAGDAKELDRWQVKQAQDLDLVAYKRHYMAVAMGKKCTVVNDVLMVTLADGKTVVPFEQVEKEVAEKK